ncbi:carboxyl-terminal processing protease CtpC [Phormidium yuhuli]|uniref:carboxyl-terminal processing protease CtpC n=1 Tax=Phormidium yuhuli TaxID=2974039 RepID=UPI00403E848F
MDMATRGLVVGATVVMLSTVTIIGAGIHLKGQAFFQESPKELVDEVWQIIDKNYVDATFNQVDWRAVRTEFLDRSYESSEDAYDAIREMLEKLDDPYTRFMDPDEFRSMQIDTSGELTGVGIQLSQDQETQELIVISPIEETPAFDAGIQSQDVITQIDGQSTEGMDINEAVNLIRGRVGTDVVLTIRRGERELEFNITRARIEIHPVRHSRKDDLPGGVGYIRLTQFSQLAADEMRTAIQELEAEGIEGFILDLRSNPGGLLQASIEIARMWFDEGDIVSTVNRQGVAEVQRANGRALTDKPLVVLIDGGSASASEILSGALRDNDRAVLVGTTSFGKGLVQSVRPVGNGGGLAVTIARYLTPNGIDIDKEGIPPDVEEEISEEIREEMRMDRTLIGTERDPQYVRALEVLREKIAAANGEATTSSVPLAVP